MQVNIIEEAGYNTALYGFSLSYKDRAIPREDWWCFKVEDERRECCEEDHAKKFTFGISHEECKKYAKFIQTTKTATANASRDGGHNKFLEHIIVWIDIEASLEFWKQFDTYRVGVSKQSESSMHTLDKRNICIEDIDLTKEELKTECICDPSDIGEKNPSLEHILGLYLNYLDHIPSRLKSKLLPQGYLQRREVVLSYKVLRHIITQRLGHKLPEWKQFIDSVYIQCQHPELLPKRD